MRLQHEEYNTIQHAVRMDAVQWLLRAAMVACIVVFGVTSVTGGILGTFMRATAQTNWVDAIARPSIIWALMGMALLLFRTVLWFGYRPAPRIRLGEAPALTVIIPAYNEGAMVEKAIESVIAARYPKDRLEVFVVDDGSKDDTWRYMERAARRHPELITAVRFTKNRGKRAALYEGFRKGRGEVFVTIDSDSVIDPETLLEIVGPFADPRVGAAAGKVMVYNKGKGLIPRMLDVRFVLSFDFLRAVQSTYGTVYCCPGALSAYRAEAVRKVMDPWMEQTFLGERCTYGEDRAMTNYILDQGYDTVYQRTAVVRTEVPETYSKLCRMFIRWDRSYIKEEIRFAAIVWKRPWRARLIALADTVITNLRYPVGYASIVLLGMMIVQDPATIGRMLSMIGLMAAFNSLYYLHSERSWDFVYGIVYAYFSFFGLMWIFPYAMATVRSRSWLTR